MGETLHFEKFDSADFESADKSISNLSPKNIYITCFSTKFKVFFHLHETLINLGVLIRNIMIAFENSSLMQANMVFLVPSFYDLFKIKPNSEFALLINNHFVKFPSIFLFL